MSINWKSNGMNINMDARPQERNSAEGHKSSSANATPVALVTYKSFAPCANGLLFSLILHAPTIKQAKEEDAMWAIHNWREYGVRPETQNMGGRLTLQ